MKIDKETKMRMIKKELGVDADSKKTERLLNGALATVIIFVPIAVVTYVIDTLMSWF